MRAPRLLILFAVASALIAADQARLVSVGVVDQDYLRVHVEEGIVTFVDDASGATAYGGHEHEPYLNNVLRYGTVDVAQATTPGTWTLFSDVDADYRGGAHVSAVHRTTKLNGMAQMGWNVAAGWDYIYEHTLEHIFYLRLPTAMEQGATYTLSIGGAANIDTATVEITFDIFASRSESVKINLNGYDTLDTIKAADLYLWMGDGGGRDYSAFEGNAVYLVDERDDTVHEVGSVSFWKPNGGDVWGRNLIQSAVWNADFSGFITPGTWRLAIEGVGCSPSFEIRPAAFREPFLVSTRGFFYMRIGQDSMDMTPVPRRPLYIPGQDPDGFKVVKTTMHPWHPDWPGGGDRWDEPDFFAQYVQSGSPENPDAWGGHSDALDWDRHLGHISIIHDLLLPYLMTDGALDDDDLGLAESGNGIPDIIDEARYEVDFWLRLRDGDGYAHGLTNAKNGIMYQAAATPLAAWAAAANAAMLADAFRIAGRASERDHYLAEATEAYAYANGLQDPWLDTTLGAGFVTYRGRDLKMLAAAHLYNLTGDTAYEDVIAAESVATSTTARISQDGSHDQFYASAAYLITPQAINHPDLQSRMRASIEHQAVTREAGLRFNRPSRRGTENDHGYFHVIQNMQGSIIAHACSDDASLKAGLLEAMTLEADWSLGRNPLNMIQMTTATTPLAVHRSVDAAYTSGRNDGTPGLHPGHTPYMNMDDWYGGMIMGRPSWMSDRGYPAKSDWPAAELHFNTRYVWAHAEFTPQQTMRGKQALYAYLYAVGKRARAAWRSVVMANPAYHLWTVVEDGVGVSLGSGSTTVGPYPSAQDVTLVPGPFGVD